MKNGVVGGSLILVCVSCVQRLFAQQACEDLKKLQLAKAEITSASLVPAGPSTVGAQQVARVPERCIVKVTARPTSDSEIKLEVWLPRTGWNGKYRQVGNGGWAGSIPVGDLVDGVLRGFAAAGTDDGHAGGGTAAWAIGHPEKLIDFGYRALHETRSAAAAIIKTFYGREAEHAYFTGCSDGGREALMVAQRFPEDFDGILAGAPANNWSHLFAGFVWNEQALLQDPASAIPPAKLAIIQKASLSACDLLDGVKDGLVEDPGACRFDPAVLLCKAGDGPECLTAAQVESLKRIYAGPKNPRTGERIFPGYPAGTENGTFGWSAWITPANPAAAIQFMFGNTYFGQAVFEQTNWNFRKLNFDSDLEFAVRKAGFIDSTSPDLRTFRAHGGKLIQYHGWGDAAISAFSSIDYYKSVKSFLASYPDAKSDAAKPVEDFYRLFLVPGMGHCGGGAGPNSFGQTASPNAASGADPARDVVAALERWVEKGVAPEKIIGKGKAPEDASKELTRPLCMYPATARYKGAGDVLNAASFECAVPPTPR